MFPHTPHARPSQGNFPNLAACFSLSVLLFLRALISLGVQTERRPDMLGCHRIKRFFPRFSCYMPSGRAHRARGPAMKGTKLYEASGICQLPACLPVCQRRCFIHCPCCPTGAVFRLFCTYPQQAIHCTYTSHPATSYWGTQHHLSYFRTTVRPVIQVKNA